MLVYRIQSVSHESFYLGRGGAYDLLNDLARRVQVDQTFMDLELVTIPSL